MTDKQTVAIMAVILWSSGRKTMDDSLKESVKLLREAYTVNLIERGEK